MEFALIINFIISLQNVGAVQDNYREAIGSIFTARVCRLSGGGSAVEMVCECPCGACGGVARQSYAWSA
jgi:hypothetical protein